MVLSALFARLTKKSGVRLTPDFLWEIGTQHGLAGTFRILLSLGALIDTDDQATEESLRLFGKKLGLAYPIVEPIT